MQCAGPSCGNPMLHVRRPAAQWSTTWKDEVHPLTVRTLYALAMIHACIFCGGFLLFFLSFFFCFQCHQMRPGWRPPRSRPLLQERGGAKKKQQKQKIIIIIILNSIRKIIWGPQWRSSVGRLRVVPYHMDALPLLQLLI